MLANILVELFYQFILGIIVYLCYYYAALGYVSTPSTNNFVN